MCARITAYTRKQVRHRDLLQEQRKERKNKEEELRPGHGGF
jgi:hypothetical protein